jgi:hypothetical protein
MSQFWGALHPSVPSFHLSPVFIGTGQLVGLTGKMTINIAEGKHSYDFEYTLPDAP